VRVPDALQPQRRQPRGARGPALVPSGDQAAILDVEGGLGRRAIAAVRASEPPHVPAGCMRRGQASPVSGRRLRRLCLVISTLGAGGAERVLSTLANRWAAEGHSVTLVTLSGAGDDFYRLDDSIERVGLDVIGVSRRPRDAVIQNLRRIRKLREAIVASRPDVVVSFMNTVNVLTLLAATRLGVPTIVS